MPDLAARAAAVGAPRAHGRPPPPRVRVCHVITGLGAGGAEWMLHSLLSATDRGRFDPVVVSLLPGGIVADAIRELGVPVHSLRLRGVWDAPAGVVRLARLLRRLRPDVVQGWMTHANLMAGAAARLAGGVPVAWGIHNVNIGGGTNNAFTRSTIWIGGVLSGRLPGRIVYCAQTALRAHEAVGYEPGRGVVIPNGFDVDAFRPDPAAGAAVRAELGIPADAPVVGLVARWDPLKDHETFVAAAGRLAAGRLAAGRPDARFVLAGRGVDAGNAALARMLEAAGIADRCHLLGDRRDVARVLAALDVSALSSRMEAFPLVVGEAMACGVPCVVTDVGDAALLVGDTGRVVPPGDPEAMAAAWRELLELPPEARARLGLRARARIVERYSLRTAVDRYQALHLQLAAGTGRAAAPREGESR
ncbi:MAG TPA: glycosyltransferase [Longimicrobium sp.]|nr:glycosyltransferase [Longimicrobium sp.]